MAGPERSGYGGGGGAESDGDGGVKTDGELKKVRDNANEERRSEGGEMGQSAEERICGLRRNGPAMPHKYEKQERKGGRIRGKRGGNAEETGTQRKKM